MSSGSGSGSSSSGSGASASGGGGGGGVGWIKGRFFHDADGDGTEFNAAGGVDAGIGGARIELLNGHGNVVAVTYTDAQGNYQFDVPDGHYKVRFPQQDGKMFTHKDVGDDRFDSDAGQDGVTHGFDIWPGKTMMDVDAGVKPTTGSISGRVFHDANGDGLEGAAEAGQAGVTVTLLDASGNPVLSEGDLRLITTVTDADGNYTFDDLPAGDYRVKVDLPGQTLAPGGLQPNAGTWDADGGPNGITAIEFNGGNGAGATFPSSTVGGDFTISAWARFDDLNGHYQRVFDLSNGAGRDNVLLTQVAGTDNIAFVVHDAVGGGTIWLEVQDAIVPGEFAHWTVTGTADGTYTLYKDGVEIGSLTGQPAVPTIVRGVNLLGDSPWGHDSTLDGAIAGFQISDGVLSDAEIDDLAFRPNKAFTTQNAGSNDAIDSDVDASGVSDAVSIGAGQDVTDVDAGLVAAFPAIDAIDDSITVLENEGAGDTETLDSGAGTILENDTEAGRAYEGDVVEIEGTQAKVGQFVQLFKDLDGDGVADSAGRVRVNADGQVDFDADGDGDGVSDFVALETGETESVTFDYTIQGDARPGDVPKHNIVFVIDVSGSTSPARFAGSAVGDQNGDGVANSVLDAEIAAYKALAAQIAASGLKDDDVDIALISFSGNSGSNQNGVSQLLGTFKPSDPALANTLNGLRDGGFTNFEAPLQVTTRWFEDQGATLADENIVYFLSDGKQNRGGAFNDESADLANRFGAELNAVGVGGNAVLSQLNVIDNTGGAEIVTTTDALTAALVDTVDPIPGASDTATVTVVIQGESDPVGSVAGRIFRDVNRDNRDNNEPGFDSLWVALIDVTTNQIVAWTRTDSTGAYTFNDVDPSDYQVLFRVDALFDTFDIATPNQGDDIDDSDAVSLIDFGVNSAGNRVAEARTAAFTVAADQDVTDVDAGLQERPGSISGRLFEDVGRDNTELRQGGGFDAGIAGQIVQLIDDSGAVAATDTTGPNGEYSFNVLPGTYQVQFPLLQGFVFAQQDVFTLMDDIDSDANANGLTNAVTISAAQNVIDVDAGLQPLPGSISGRLFADADRDNTERNDAGGLDAGIAGRTIQLLDTSGAVVATATTGANGEYSFTVEAGDYQVQFPLAQGQAFATQNVGSDTEDSDADATGLTAVISVGRDQDVTDVDAGLQELLGSIAGRYFRDTDGDNLDNGNGGEPAVANQIVVLLDSTGAAVLDAAGNPLFARTDSNGEYRFDDIPAGDYKVGFSTGLPPRFVDQGADLDGNGESDDPSASDVDSSQEGMEVQVDGSNVVVFMTDIFTVVAGENKVDVDAGIDDPNDPPIALDDIEEPILNDALVDVNNQPVVITAQLNALTNDSDPDGDPITITSAGTDTTADADGWFDWQDASNGGEIRLNVDGTFQFRDSAFVFEDLTPSNGIVETSLGYTITDGNGENAGADLVFKIEADDNVGPPGGGTTDPVFALRGDVTTEAAQTQTLTFIIDHSFDMFRRLISSVAPDANGDGSLRVIDSVLNQIATAIGGADLDPNQKIHFILAGETGPVSQLTLTAGSVSAAVAANDLPAQFEQAFAQADGTEVNTEATTGLDANGNLIQLPNGRAVNFAEALTAAKDYITGNGTPSGPNQSGPPNSGFGANGADRDKIIVITSTDGTDSPFEYDGLENGDTTEQDLYRNLVAELEDDAGIDAEIDVIAVNSRVQNTAEFKSDFYDTLIYQGPDFNTAILGEPVLDANGNPTVDEFGLPVLSPVLDANGNEIVIIEPGVTFDPLLLVDLDSDGVVLNASEVSDFGLDSLIAPDTVTVGEVIGIELGTGNVLALNDDPNVPNFELDLIELTDDPTTLDVINIQIDKNGNGVFDAGVDASVDVKGTLIDLGGDTFEFSLNAVDDLLV